MPRADAKEKFAKDFVAAWTKVMNADRFDLDKDFAARSGVIAFTDTGMQKGGRKAALCCLMPELSGNLRLRFHQRPPAVIAATEQRTAIHGPYRRRRRQRRHFRCQRLVCFIATTMPATSAPMRRKQLHRGNRRRTGRNRIIHQHDTATVEQRQHVGIEPQQLAGFRAGDRLNGLRERVVVPELARIAERHKARVAKPLCDTIGKSKTEASADRQRCRRGMYALVQPWRR